MSHLKVRPTKPLTNSDYVLRGGAGSMPLRWPEVTRTGRSDFAIATARKNSREIMNMRTRRLCWLDVCRLGALLIFVASAAVLPAQTPNTGEPEQAGPYGSLLIRDVTVID